MEVENYRSLARWFAGSWIGLAALLLLIAFFLALTKHAAVFIGATLALTIALNLFAHPPHDGIQSRLVATLKGFLPVAVLFAFAISVATPTAFDPKLHLTVALKIAALQLIVLGAFATGRELTNVREVAVIRWAVIALIFATSLLVEEQTWHALRTVVATKPAIGGYYQFETNRSFLTISLALSFVLLASQQTKNYALMIATTILMAVILFFTGSESARLVIAGSILLLTIPQRFLSSLFSIAFFGAIAWIAAGPFVYPHMLALWDASPLHDFMKGTLQYRMQIWADTSALILDSSFLGRGMSVLEKIAENRHLFEMPHGSYGWHPHSAGLQVAADLGVPGMLWLGVILHSIRSHVLSSVQRYQRPLMATILMFLVVSFLADGLWQTWWWATAAIIAAWTGILSTSQMKS